MIKKLTILTAILSAIVISCSKPDVTEQPANFLKFSWATAHVTNKKGSVAVVKIQSDIAWKLTIEKPLPTWMVIDKYNGINSDSLIITATEDNTTGGYKFAGIVATAINNNGIPPVYLTVVQYDSTFKGK